MAIREKRAAQVTTAEKPSAEALVKDVFLTDGERLYRILSVVELHVQLEDCANPQGLSQWMGVNEVVQRLRLVRPAL